MTPARPRFRLALLIGLLGVTAPGLARAQALDQAPSDERTEPTAGGGTPLVWDEAWGHVGTGEFIASGAGITAALISILVGPNEDTPWRGGVLFDDAARDLLGVSGRGAQQIARDASDILLATLTAYPFVIDSAIVAHWYRSSPTVALEMSLINMEVIALNLGLEGLSNVLFSRERPYGQQCGLTLDEQHHDCRGNRRYHSFFSGHTSTAFAAAGLICSHHMNLPLYGGGAADTAPCVGAFLMAGATGALRIVADQHYATDVLSGALIGTTLGLGIPWLLHYRHRRDSGPPDGAQAPPALQIQVVPTPFGLGAVGTF